MNIAGRYVGEIVVCVIALAAISALPVMNGIDHWVQEFFYSRSDGRWLVSPEARGVVHLVFYRGIKLTLVLAISGLAAWLLFRSWMEGWDDLATRISVGLIAAISTPVIVGLLKKTTGISCPVQETDYGGYVAHIVIWQQLSEWKSLGYNLHCWPAGHASGGFALLVARLWSRGDGSNEWKWMAPGLIVGWIMGLYQMARGQHYLSHTVATMLIAWAITSLALLVSRKLEERREAQMTGGFAVTTSTRPTGLAGNSVRRDRKSPLSKTPSWVVEGAEK